MHALDIGDFLEQYKKSAPLLIDARSEGEFAKGHIPGAVNIALLNNEHRSIVGITYKKKGRHEAVLKGFELAGPLFHSMISKVKELSNSPEVMVYCWRGGMRSGVLCWMLQMAGFRTTVLKGGYKRFRNWAAAEVMRDRSLMVLGGKTGSGKTELLQRLRQEGEQVICLESLACHKGSAFGGLGQKEQPSQEHFENTLAWQLSHLVSSRPVWVENESRTIGSIKIPDAFFQLMRSSPVVEIVVDIEERKHRIFREYAVFDADILAEKTVKLAKRMGGQHVKEALDLLAAGNINGWVEVLLDYYDKTYEFSNNLRNGSMKRVQFSWKEAEKHTLNITLINVM